jgi:uridine monophosphate synthetase
MESFFSQLEARVQEANSLLCIGLDPHPDDLPPHESLLARSAIEIHMALAAKETCIRLIELTADYAAAFKPNIAFFEMWGSRGLMALLDVIAAIPAKIPVILDAKRGDIASTAEAYAHAAFEMLETNAITLSPYLGHDSLQPFLRNPARGAFLLCKTSNSGSGDLQDLPVIAGTGRSPVALYEQVARLAQSWNVNDNLGLVVGATYPEALARARAAAPDLWFLSPGVGAQGGQLRTALQAGLRGDGSGMLINVSRNIARAADPRRAAELLRGEINDIRQQLQQEWEAGEARPDPHAELNARVARGLLEAGCVRFGKFTLKSGLLSPIYIDMRQLIGHPTLLAQAASAYLPLLQQLTFDRLAALPYAAVPIGAAISLQSGWPLIYPRKESKEYGTRAEVEGVFNPGERAVVIDDLTTTGSSKFEAIEKLTAAGLQVSDVVVLIDRQSGATEALAEHGIRMHSVFDLTQLLDIWEETGQVDPRYMHATRLWLKGQS